MEETLVPRAGLPLQTIAGGPIAGVPVGTKVMNGAKLVSSVGRAYGIIGRFRPNVVFMTGGYVNVPVAMAARARRVPVAIYLPDIEPGSAIRLLSRLADKVACTADASQAYFRPGQTVVTGYPVRGELRDALALSRDDARRQFDLGSDRPTVFVYGGSRGAWSINQALMAILPQLLPVAQVIHISGTLTWPQVEANAATLPDELRARYRPMPYLHEQMGAAYRAADLVVARAGASMLGECPAFGVPAVMVPYPHAWRYQKVNADYLVERGAALRLDDAQLGAQLWPTLQALLENRSQLAAMAAAAHQLDRPEAARHIADVLMALAA